MDVNVGLPEINEPAVMENAIKEIQAVSDLPLQIDTSDFSAMERAMIPLEQHVPAMSNALSSIHISLLRNVRSLKIQKVIP